MANTMDIVLSTHKNGEPVQTVGEHRLCVYLVLLGIPREYPIIETDKLADREIYILTQGFEIKPIPSFVWSYSQLALFTHGMMRRIERHADRVKTLKNGPELFRSTWVARYGQRHSDHIFVVASRISQYMARQITIPYAAARNIKSRGTHARDSQSEKDLDYLVSPCAMRDAECNSSWFKRHTDIHHMFRPLPAAPTRKTKIKEPVVPEYFPISAFTYVKDNKPSSEIIVPLTDNPPIDDDDILSLFRGDDVEISQELHDLIFADSDSDDGDDTIGSNTPSAKSPASTVKLDKTPRTLLPPTKLVKEIPVARVRVFNKQMANKFIPKRLWKKLNRPIPYNALDSLTLSEQVDCKDKEVLRAQAEFANSAPRPVPVTGKRPVSTLYEDVEYAEFKDEEWDEFKDEEYDENTDEEYGEFKDEDSEEEGVVYKYEEGNLFEGAVAAYEENFELDAEGYPVEGWNVELSSFDRMISQIQHKAKRTRLR